MFVDNWAAGKYYKLLVLSAEEAAKSDNIKWKITFSKA
jgi:hypothetical protein